MKALPLALALSVLAACGARTGIRPFYSDGCSLFPDGKVGDRRLWCDCCFTHDIAYWRGGTEAERQGADEALRRCVLERTRDARLAAVMYDGVRLGGSPVFPNWYRWAYGWPYGRGYAPLSAAERGQAAEALRAYYARQPGGYCAR
ncbi:MAG TPA: hypothetical protein VLT47_01310 [Anaeromyxobacteraceae bacterium]|nr:hypothetical protein [Anaeromyxobacteraceae bacterium]